MQDDDHDDLFLRWETVCDEAEAQDHLYAPRGTAEVEATILGEKLVKHYDFALQHIPELKRLGFQGASLPKPYASPPESDREHGVSRLTTLPDDARVIPPAEHTLPVSDKPVPCSGLKGEQFVNEWLRSFADPAGILFSKSARLENGIIYSQHCSRTISCTRATARCDACCSLWLSSSSGGHTQGSVRGPIHNAVHKWARRAQKGGALCDG